MPEHQATPNPADRLQSMRGEIDGVDRLIVALVAARTALTVEIGREKRRLGIATFVPGRHHEVINNYMGAVPEWSPMTRSDAASLSEVVQQISRDAQDRSQSIEADTVGSDRDALGDLAAQAAERLAEYGGVAPLPQAPPVAG